MKLSAAILQLLVTSLVGGILLPVPGAAQESTSPRAELTQFEATGLELVDAPNDNGTALLLLFDMQGYGPELRVGTEVLIDGEWAPSGGMTLIDAVPVKGEMPGEFGWNPPEPDKFVLTVDRYQFLDDKGEADTVPLQANETYLVRLVARDPSRTAAWEAGSAQPTEQWFNQASTNNLILCLIFAVIILAFIFAARRNPNLFIRRIQGLEAVDEAIGRATEMGKPVLHLNGLDPLSTLSTLAAVNILGRIARRIATYDSELIVPCFDPVVMTVSQEVVKNAYLEAGRPDAYREDRIYFVTDQQFSYVATVCGLMVRERPAANFFLGYFYAESLLLAETGSMTGAIQIAGTDALAQLPFFITTCDYTLIGEELYAASAYLSREPMLLGSLKGQDVGKAFVLAVILLGTILATFGVDWLNQLLTPLS